MAVCEYLESNDEEQITISELVSKMGEYLLEDDSVPYGSQYLKQKLKEHYNDSIYIAEVEGLQDIVTMRLQKMVIPKVRNVQSLLQLPSS